MSAIVQALIAELDDDALDTLAAALAPRLERLANARAGAHEAATWLNARQAAEYMACPLSRIYDLKAIGALNPRPDGRRLKFRRSDLDAYLEGSA